MKKIIALFLFFYCSFYGVAQTFSGAEAQRYVKAANLVTFNKERKSISFSSFQIPVKVSNEEQEEWLKKEVLKVSLADNIKLCKIESDQIGFIHYRYKQLYKNIEVENGVYYIHKKGEGITSVNGEFYSGIDIEVRPLINKDNAFQRALLFTNSKQYIWEKDKTYSRSVFLDSTKLVIIKNDAKYYLTYRSDIYSLKPLTRKYVYVDAITGKIIKTENRLHNIDSKGTAVTGYNGTKQITTDSISANLFYLRETGRGGGIETINETTTSDFSDLDNVWNNTANLDNYATDAHWGAEKTYDFYKAYFGRNSIDNADKKIVSHVHITDGGLPMANAFWDGDAMQYGDGDGVDYGPFTSLEIIGHELTHGVTQFSASLGQNGESAELNESFSDIFGASMRFIYSSSVGNWVIGDQIVIPSSAGQPTRNMANPNQFLQPDTYGGLYWQDPITSNDPHINNGVQNYWYYLLCEGGSGTNDLNNPYSVTSIGMNDALKIAYRNLTVYLTPNSTFEDARNYSNQSAIDLFGICSNQQIQNLNAWYAVGVGASASPFELNFTSSSNFSCTAPLTVSYTSINNALGNSFWDFGDGTNSALANPSHIYNTPGLYNVKLVTHGSGACVSFSDSITKAAYVKIGAIAPVPDFSYSPNVIAPNTAVLFTDKSVNNPIGWKWDFGDGGNAFVTNPNHSFTLPGTYSVKLVVTNCNSKDSITKQIIVSPELKLCTDVSSNQASGFLFDSGGPTNNYNNNENCSFLINPPCASSITLKLSQFMFESLQDSIFIYDGSDDKAYNVQKFSGELTPSGGTFPPLTGTSGHLFIVVHTNSTVTDSGFKAMWSSKPVIKKPAALFFSNPASASAFDVIQFNNASQNGSSSWKWDFGDLSTSTLENPSHIYTSAGTYNVKLVVKNCIGADSMTQSVTITPTSVYELQEQNCKIFPNPSNGKININLNTGYSDNTFAIYSITGKLLKEVLFTGKEYQMDVEDLSNGIYFIEIKNIHTIFRKKIIIAK